MTLAGFITVLGTCVTVPILSKTEVANLFNSERRDTSETLRIVADSRTLLAVLGIAWTMWQASGTSAAGAASGLPYIGP